MNHEQSTETEFSRRLRAELRAIVAERGVSQVAGTTRSAWHRPDPRLGIAAVTAIAIAAVVLIVSAGGNDTPAAFAVEARPEGEVAVEIRRLEDAKGLEEALTDAGVPASVSFLQAGMTCKEPRFQQAPWPDESRAVIQAKISGTGPDRGPPFVVSGPLRFSISREAVGPGQTLIIVASASAKGEGFFDPGTQVSLAEGTVSPCEPVPSSDPHQ